MSRGRRAGALLSILAAFLLVALACIALTGQGFLGTDQFYNSYSLQARAWLDGRLDLADGASYSWLELAIRDGKYYVSFPPFPSLVLLPLVAVFGVHTPDTLVALIFAALACFHAVRLCQLLLPRRRYAAYWALGLLLCNGYLFLCLNGWVWFLAQNICFALSLASLHHAVKGRGLLSLAAWAAAVGCRPMTAIFGPFLLWLLWREIRAQKPGVSLFSAVAERLHWAILPLLLALFYMALNFLRFGNPLEFGHNYLPEFSQYGAQFSLSYIAPNLATLMRPPQFAGGRLIPYTIEGWGVWLLNPMLFVGIGVWLCGCRQNRGGASLWLLPLSCLACLVVILMHRTLGGWQFGNRYMVDLLPWVFFGILIHHPQTPGGCGLLVKLSGPSMLLAGLLQTVGTVATYLHWI